MQFKFEDFVLDPVRGELLHAGQPVTMEPQVFRVLTHLIENRDRVVSKDDLVEAIWGGRAISDGALNSRINSLRRALGDDGKTQSIIRTLPRRGYRFVAQIDDPELTLGLASDGSIQKPTLAVLPFTNWSGDQEDAYFSDGITEDVISALSRFGWFLVVARNSSFAFRGKNLDIREISRQLRAKYVLDGSTRRSGKRLRLSVHLVDGESGNQIWTEKYDRDLDDVFSVQDEISKSVAGAIEPAVEFAEYERSKAKPVVQLDTWDLFLRGKSKFYMYAPDDLAEATVILEKVIELEPDFAPAYTVLSFAYQRQVVFEYAASIESTLARARELAETGIRLNRDDADAQAALGWLEWYEGDINEAVAILSLAVELNPSHADAHSQLGIALAWTGRAEEGLLHHHTAIRLSPRDPAIAIMYGRLANSCVFAGRYEDAVNFGRHAIRLSGGRFWMPYVNTISALGHLNRLEEAQHLTNRLRVKNSRIGPTTLRRLYRAAEPVSAERYFCGLRKAGWKV